jgi:glycosyltransferase involved in cell wall biosynthesis
VLTDVVVVAGEVRAAEADLGFEIRSLGKERGRSRLGRGIAYQRAVADLARTAHRPVLFAHMCPTYVVWAAPVARLSATPAMLWFAHYADTPTLRRAERLADVLVTTLAGTFPRPGPKVRAIGQAIDTARFAYSDPRPRAPGDPLHLVAVGRTSAMKNYPTMVRAIGRARAAGVDVRLRIVGASTTGPERAHRAEIEALIVGLGLADAVGIDDGIPHDRVPEVLARADALVNGSKRGTADKTVFEAMSCGRPVIVSNPVFAGLLDSTSPPLLYDEEDDAMLARRIAGLASAPADHVVEIGRDLRRRVEQDHSIDHWAEQVLGLCQELRSRPRYRPRRRR